MSFVSTLTLLTILALRLSFAESQSGGSGQFGDEATRAKRDPKSNVIPFPRTGRGRLAAYPQIWAPLNYDSSRYLRLLEAAYDSDEENENWDEISDQKRVGLIPFPRVGRSGSGPKRNGAGNGGGSLWFGPRLGKRTFHFNRDMNPPINIPDYFRHQKGTTEDTPSPGKLEDFL